MTTSACIPNAVSISIRDTLVVPPNCHEPNSAAEAGYLDPSVDVLQLIAVSVGKAIDVLDVVVLFFHFARSNQALHHEQR